MLQLTAARVAATGRSDLVELRDADVHQLPFDDGRF